MVYVDAIFIQVSRDPQARRAGARIGHKWCHMWADTLGELHCMAQSIMTTNDNGPHES